MELSFAKLHGLGNDFVFIDDRDRALSLTDAQVSYLCDRHFGIGADGVILVRPGNLGRGRRYMHYINADGTLAKCAATAYAASPSTSSIASWRTLPRDIFWPTPWPVRAPSPFPWMRGER